MPGLNIENLKTPNKEENSNNTVPGPQEAPREITQTDRLNKRLLEAFLLIINRSNPTGEKINSDSDEEQDFDD